MSPHVTNTDAPARRDCVTGKKVDVASSRRSGDEKNPNVVAGPKSKSRAAARRRGSIAEMASNVVRRLSSYGMHNRQGNVAVHDDSDKAATIDDEVQERDVQEENGTVAPTDCNPAVAGSKSKSRAAARRRGSIAERASNVARRLSTYGKKNRQGNDTAATIDELKKGDEKGNVSLEQPRTQAPSRRGSVTDRLSQALRLMTHEMRSEKSSRRPDDHKSKLATKRTISGIFNSLMAGESVSSKPASADQGKYLYATEWDAAKMPKSAAASTTKQSFKGRHAHADSGESCLREFLS